MEGAGVTDRLPELLDSKGLQAELGISRAVAEKLMRQLPVVTFPDIRKVYVRRSDALALVEARTFLKDEVRDDNAAKAGRLAKYHRDSGRALVERLDNAPPCPSRCILRSSRGFDHRRSHMATITISKRKTACGKRYDVRYRLGGRSYPVVRAGTFKTEREAKARHALVSGEIAHGRNPAELLDALARDTTAPTMSLSTWVERFLASRIDIDANTKKNYTSALKKIGETFGDRDPSTITATEIAEWIADLSTTRKPGTLNQYMIAFRLLLDHVGLEPNVARDPTGEAPEARSRRTAATIGRALRGDHRGARAEVEAAVRHHRTGCAAARGGGQSSLGGCRRCGSSSPATEVCNEA